MFSSITTMVSGLSLHLFSISFITSHYGVETSSPPARRLRHRFVPLVGVEARTVSSSRSSLRCCGPARGTSPSLTRLPSRWCRDLLRLHLPILAVLLRSCPWYQPVQNPVCMPPVVVEPSGSSISPLVLQRPCPLSRNVSPACALLAYILVLSNCVLLAAPSLWRASTLAAVRDLSLARPPTRC